MTVPTEDESVEGMMRHLDAAKASTDPDHQEDRCGNCQDPAGEVESVVAVVQSNRPSPDGVRTQQTLTVRRCPYCGRTLSDSPAYEASRTM
jgi:uncharacterized protein with PIN domain